MKDKNILLLVLPCMFTLDNKLKHIRPLRFNSYAMSLFASYLEGNNLQYYDLDVHLSEYYHSFDEYFSEFKYPDDFDNALNNYESPIWSKIFNIFNDLHLLDSEFEYILCSSRPQIDDYSMEGNRTSYLNVLLLKFLYNYFNGKSKIIVGGVGSIQILQHLKRIDSENIAHLIYKHRVENKDAFLELLQTSKITVDNSPSHDDIGYILPDNKDGLKYSYDFILNNYNINIDNKSSDFIMQASLKTSYGCVNKCAFCAIPKNFVKINNNIWQDNIFKLVDQGVNTIFFKDSTINPNRKTADDFCNFFIKNNLKIQWSNSCNFKNTDADFFKMVYDAGGRLLCFGAESCNDNMLKIINKKITQKDIETGIINSHNAGIWNLLNFIVGFPYDDEYTVGDSLYFIKNNIKYIDEISLTRFYMTYSSDMFVNPEKYRIEFNRHILRTRCPTHSKESKVEIDKEEDAYTNYHYEAYRELDRYGYDEVEEYKTKLHSIACSFISPLGMRIPQHLIFTLYSIFDGNKTKVREVIDNQYRRINYERCCSINNNAI